MNYIILDLEWNMGDGSIENREENLPVEIVEIGAVKLNEKLNIVSSFDHYIKPQIYTEFNDALKHLVHLDMKKVNSGESFESVFRKFMSWCGEDVIFCTWGAMDLFELQRNMAYYNIENTFPMPFVYYDIQKFYSILKEDGKQRRTLEYVVNELGIKSLKDFHNALNDAHYTALVCKNIDFHEIKARYSIDCYRIPQSKSEEIYANYDTYQKFISKGYSSREMITKDKRIMTNKCYLCGKTLNTLMPWSVNANKAIFYVGKCEEHGYVKSRIRIRQTDKGEYYATRITKVTTEEGALNLINRRADKKSKDKK